MINVPALPRGACVHYCSSAQPAEGIRLAWWTLCIRMWAPVEVFSVGSGMSSKHMLAPEAETAAVKTIRLILGDPINYSGAEERRSVNRMLQGADNAR